MARLNLGQIAKHAAFQRASDEERAKEAVPSAEVQKLPDGNGDELARLRGILFGQALEQQELDLSRIENRFASHATEVQQSLDDLTRRLDERLSALTEQTGSEQHRLADQVKSQSEELRRSIVERTEHTRDHLNRGLAVLRADKLDRGKLAGLLLEIGDRVDASGESNVEASQ